MSVADVSTSDHPVAERGGFLASLLFCAIFLFALVSLSPFGDLTQETGGSLALDQLSALALALAALLYAAAQGLLPIILRPRFVIVLAFGWLAFVSLAAPDIATALRRLLVAGLFSVSASVLLVLPADRRHFGALIAFCVAVVLGLCYFGVIALPAAAVHQTGDFLEPGLAGDWRGVFDHKNIAAPAMVVLFFFCLYVGARWSAPVGLALALLAFVFLIQTNGKSALGLLPVTLVLAWVLERAPVLGGMIVVAVLAALNILTVGAAFLPAIADFVEGLGVDASFTSRADVWRVALAAIAERPWTGYGFDSFWQSDMLLNSEMAGRTWAVNAAHAHNSYMEMMIDGGVPALALALVWLLLMPLRDIWRARRRSAEPALTRLYTRIWLFAMILACLESHFFQTSGTLWFALLVAVFGLHFQSGSVLVDEREQAR